MGASGDAAIRRVMSAPHSAHLLSSEGADGTEGEEKSLLAPWTPKEREQVRALVARLPDQYLTVIPVAERRIHNQLMHQLMESDVAAVVGKWNMAGKQTRFHVVHRNRVGSLGVITSLLSNRGFNILNASVFSTNDGWAVNAFWLEPPEDAVHPSMGLIPIDDLIFDIDRTFSSMSLHSTPSNTPPPPGWELAGSAPSAAGSCHTSLGSSPKHRPTPPPPGAVDELASQPTGVPGRILQPGGAVLEQPAGRLPPPMGRTLPTAGPSGAVTASVLEALANVALAESSAPAAAAAFLTDGKPGEEEERGTPVDSSREASKESASAGPASPMTGWPDEWHQPQFDTLKLIRQVAEGSQSCVWEGDWGGALVAVKILRAEPRASPSAIEAAQSLLREVKIWSALRHPAICGFMGTCVQQGLPAIVLEFLPGSLHDLLHKPTSKQKLRQLPERAQVQIGREIATGVAYLHSEQLIHRDIKAANVLLDPQMRVKLADFGISTKFENSAGTEHTAETGTYRYMAPEVIRHQQYDHKCDVYSYGVLLWEVLHRQVPFRTHSPLQAAYAVAMQRERPPIALKHNLAPFAPVILACWDEAPNKRPNMTEVVEMLTALEAALPAPPDGSSSGGGGGGGGFLQSIAGSFKKRESS